MATPPLSPANLAAYNSENSSGGKLWVLRRDFNATSPVQQFSSIIEKSPSQKSRVEKWIPDLLSTPRFLEYVDAIKPIATNRSTASGVPRYFRRFLYIAVGAFLWVSLPDLILRGARWSITEHTGWTDPAVYTRYLWIYDPERFRTFKWAIPDIVLETNPLPILSFISYSPAIALAAILVGLTFPSIITRICLLWLVPLVPIVWIAGLGAIPALRLWALSIGMTCLIGAVVTCIRSREFLTQYLACQSLFTASYWPFVRELLPKSNSEEERLRMAQYSAELNARKMRYENRKNSQQDYDQFLRSEADANSQGYSSIPGSFHVGQPGMGQPTLADLIRRGPHQTTAAELAQAANITEHDASVVLRGSSARTMPEHLRSLYEEFHSPGPR
ncbi:hypothetical protein [Gordonia terrae]|uniref:hypothetical protein n=1 Tax=Gordonia terrae TaxID=2055 RepID=UPI0012680AEC|nr:hypothetical protein [Gordonia terrae]